MPSKTAKPFVPPDTLPTAFNTNDRINPYLIETWPAESWRAEPPAGKGRDIASIVAHMHNVRVMWLKAAGGKASPERDAKIPEHLHRTKVTPAQARKGLSE